ncbi:hypothetical protein F5Y03DRAFT_359849 [Xylaria venustula]|nr:hypothetical protein F5Y03DRAFT_359849 [Xylaria venustula]
MHTCLYTYLPFLLALFRINCHMFMYHEDHNLVLDQPLILFFLLYLYLRLSLVNVTRNPI